MVVSTDTANDILSGRSPASPAAAEAGHSSASCCNSHVSHVICETLLMASLSSFLNGYVEGATWRTNKVIDCRSVQLVQLGSGPVLMGRTTAGLAWHKHRGTT